MFLPCRTYNTDRLTYAQGPPVTPTELIPGSPGITHVWVVRLGEVVRLPGTLLP